MQSEVRQDIGGILVAAHDLKAPLCLVRQLALSLNLAEDTAARARIQSQIITTSERALKQISDLTKLARFGDGLFPLEPVSVRGVCDEVYRDLAPLFRSGQRQIVLKYHNRSRLAVANRELLSSAVRNLCTNALHYSDAETASRLEISDQGKRIRIGVRDYGPSLPTKVWRKIHSGGIDQPTAVAMRSESSGLGLFFVSQFARYMHCDFGATRHHDGTSFFIDLPASHQATLF